MTSLREFYAAGYSVGDPVLAERLGRWRALGAASKAAHAVALCRAAGVVPQTVVEIGAGDGALLGALSARGLGSVYDGFELSPAAAALAARRPVAGARRIEAFDGTTVPAGDGAYDLAVISHVLEHVPEPAELLAEAARVARRVLVEVPLESNRSARRPSKVADARAIGHLQAFSRADVHRLTAVAGLRAVAELTDPLGRAHHAFFASGPSQRAAATAKWAVRHAAWRAAPLAAERLFTLHYAGLFTPRCYE